MKDLKEKENEIILNYLMYDLYRIVNRDYDTDIFFRNYDDLLEEIEIKINLVKKIRKQLTIKHLPGTYRIPDKMLKTTINKIKEKKEKKVCV